MKEISSSSSSERSATRFPALLRDGVVCWFSETWEENERDVDVVAVAVVVDDALVDPACESWCSWVGTRVSSSSVSEKVLEAS